MGGPGISAPSANIWPICFPLTSTSNTKQSRSMSRPQHPSMQDNLTEIIFQDSHIKFRKWGSSSSVAASLLPSRENDWPETRLDGRARTVQVSMTRQMLVFRMTRETESLVWHINEMAGKEKNGTWCHSRTSDMKLLWTLISNIANACACHERT